MNLNKTTESPPVLTQKPTSINSSTDLNFELRLMKLNNSNDRHHND